MVIELVINTYPEEKPLIVNLKFSKLLRLVLQQQVFLNKFLKRAKLNIEKFQLGLTWVFGFLVMIPSPNDSPYMGFIFALLFCVLNSLQGVFIFISCHVLKKLRIKQMVKSSQASSEEKTKTTSVRVTKTSSALFNDLNVVEETSIEQEIVFDLSEYF